jgi:hypothetical protein
VGEATAAGEGLAVADRGDLGRVAIGICPAAAAAGEETGSLHLLRGATTGGKRK